MTTRCPLVSLPEWKLLVNSIGEDEAYRVFIANGEEVPTIEEVNELIRTSVNDARGEFHDNSWNEGMETGDLPMPINYDAIVLTPEHTAHYINIGSAALDDDYIRRKAKGQNIINIDEAKNGFIKGFQNYIDTTSPVDKKPLNIAFLEEVKKDNSELWEAIKNNQSRKYYYKEEKYNGDIEERVKTANWSEVKEVSTEKSVLESVKRTINRLKKRLPVELDSKGNISETLSSSDTNTFSGLPERLEYKDYAGGLFLKYLGCETMSDILDRTKQIALYHPSFNELLQILKDDEDLLAAFYMNILRQAKQAKIILKTNKTINVTLEGTSFTQKMADRLNGMVLNQIKSGSFYTQELKEELTKAEYRLFTVKDGIKQSVDRDKAISIVNTIYKKLGIQINDEDIVNLFRTHELEDITNQFNTIIHGLINGESNLFARSEAFKKLEETRLNLNNSLLDATTQLSSSIDFEKEKDLKKLLIEIEKNIIVNKKEIKKFDIGSKGRLFDLSSLIEKVRIDIPDTITTNIKNKQKSMIQWNDFVSNFFNVLQNNPVEGEKILLDLIGYNYTTGSISSRSANYSEIFLGKNGLLKVVKDETKSSGTKIVLNTEVVKDFDYNEDGGIKDVFTNNAQEYDDFNKKDYIAKMLLYHINTKEGKTHLTSQFMPTPSDSGTTKIVTMRKWEVSANDYGALQATDGYDYIKGTKWFNAIWKTVLQEIVSMEDAFNIMFDKDVYLQTGKLKVLDSVKNGETVLSLNYHYKLEKGVPTYVNSEGNPTGDVFKFMNFYYKVDGKRLTLNNINDNKVVFLNQVIQNNNLTEFGNKYKLATYEFAKWHIDTHEELYKDYANEIDKDLITKSNKQYGNIVAELAINNYLAKIAMQDLFGDTLNDVGKTINVYKRSKKSPGATYGVYKDKKSEGYMSIEIDDIVKDIVIDAKKGIRLENVTVSDGMSIISREEKLNRLKRQGKYKDYKKARDAYEAGDNSVIDAITLNQDKNFYYNYFYNPITKRRESELVKNSDLTVTASVFEGSQLEDLMNLVSKLEKEFGQGVQLNFKSSKKKGNSNSIVRLHDENGNLALTEDTYNQLKKAATPQYYRNLVKVQDTSSHIVDNNILLGTQIAKSIITNLNGDSSGSYFNDSMNGETLIKEFFNIIDSNLAEASQELLDRIQDEKGNVTLKSLSDLLLKEAIDKNWDSNLIKGLQTVEGELNMPLFYSVYDKKIQEFLTSLWTNKITKQRHSGYHAFQAPNIFMGNSTSKVTGGKRKLGEITESSYIGKVNYLKSKDKDRSLKCISLNKGKILKMEVLVSRWDSKFKDLNGKPIDINDLDPSVLTSIGFRIPTEGKFSTFIFDVVGFLPDEMEGTIVVPDGFTGITGSDFDIDSIYVMTQNLTNDIKVDKYLDDSNSTLLERYEKFEAEQKAKATVDKELENKIKKTIKQSNYEFYTEDLVKAKSDYLKWFNTKYEQDVKYFYQIEKVLDSIIKQLHLELDIINTQINDRDASASDVKWHKINETAKLAILTEAVKDDNALLKFSKTALTIDEKTLKDREESIKLEKEKVIVEQSNFANYPISRQNTRKARENRIFDIFAEVLTNPSSFEEITTSSEYQELVDATADVNKSVEEYNPNILKDSIEMTSNILSNKNLKGNAVNFSNLAQISNVAKIQSKVGVSYKASKSEVAAGMTEFSYFDHIGIIRTEDGWQDRNFAGHFITSYTSKVVANIMDAVANPMAANMNEYTLNVYSIFPAFGVPNYKYPTYFISQGVVTELIKVVENKGVFYTNNEESEFTIVRNKIHKVLRLLSSLDGTLTEEETNAFMIAAQSGTVENLTKAQKDFNLKNHTQTTNKFDYDELLNDVEFFQKTNKVFDLVEILKNAVDNNATDEFINYVNKTGTTNLKNYLIRQLSILEEFQTLKNLGKDLVSLSSLLKFDRNGAGPELDVNKKTLNNLDKAAYSEEFGFLIDEENAIQAIYPTLYGTGKESAYKHLESKLLYGNLNSYDTLAPFFIQETPFLRNVLNDYEVDWAREGMKQEIRRSLLLDLEFFKTSKETRKKVLGINTPFVADLDVLDNSVSNFEDFKDLSAANQLYLIQKQYASLFSTPFETHLLSELSFDERTLDEEEFNFKKITRQNLNDKEKFSYQLGLMLSNKNKFVKELAENLIRYTFFTNGWSYGNNLASVVPMEYITGERARQLGLDISGHLKEKMVKAKTGSNAFLASDIVGNYHRRNWRNNELVVEVKNKTVFDKNIGEEVIAPFTPNWSEHDLNGFIYLSDLERDFIKNPKVANAKFIKVKQADFSFKIYRAKAVKVINSKGKLEQIGVAYIGVNKLETWEDDDTSLIETNNNSTFDSVKYDEFLTAAQDAFTADEAAKNAFSNEKDFVNYKKEETVKTEEEFTPYEDVTETINNVERYNGIIKREDVRANPTTLYLFGDNDIRKGLGGQAKEMRNEPNTIGISTKKLPSNEVNAFKTDVELENNKKIITQDINKAIDKWNTGKYVKLIIPQIGVGLAALPTKAPLTWKFLNEEFNRLEKTINGSQESSPIKENLLLEQNNEINKVTDEEDFRDIEDDYNKEDDKLNYDNIILDSDIKSTPDARLIETTKKATARILRIIDTHAFYGSFQAQKTVKGLVVKPIMSYTEAELEYVYLQIGFVNKFVFDDLGISTSGGFHSKTLTERRNIVVHLVNKYKREIEKTPKGITNKIRIPHKDINKITDLELLYNVSGIASHVISRVHYVQQEVNRWSEARKEGYKVGGVNTLYKPEEVYDLEQINRLSKLINHINSIKDIMVELDSVKWVNEGTGLTQTQIGINYIILTMNEYRDQLNNIVNDSRKLYSAYLKGVIEQTTEDPALLADASEMSKAIEKAINSIKDSTQFQLMLDSPKDSTNVILGNLIKKWNVQKNMELLKANAMKNHFVKLLEATNGNYEDIFEKTKSGQRTGKIVETSLLQDDNLKALTDFITNQLGVITQDTNKNNIVDKGFLPALAILNKSNWKIIQEKLGYFDSFDRNTKVITDMDGNSLKSVVQMYTSFIKPKHKIRIPYEKEADETNTEYDERLTDDILTVYGLSFKNRKQIEEYNKQVDNYNKLLNSAAHSENISYDLAKVIPLYITEAYQFNWKKLIENEFLMNIRMVSGMDFEVKMNTVETLVRRYTGVKKNQTKKGSATNAIKQLELWGHINIYNDFNASSAKETKWGRVLQQYTSMTGLGLNPFSGLNNVVYGSIQNKIHSVADGSFNVKDNTKAGKFYYNFNALCSYFTDKADDLKSSTLQSAIIKDIDIMNVQTEEVERAKTDISNNSFEGTASVALSGLFFFQHAGEHMMQNRLLFAMMYGARVIDGKILNWREFVESKLQVAKITDDLDTVKAKSTKNKQTLKDLRIEFDSYKNLIDCYEFKDGVAVRSAEFSDLEMAKFKDKAKNKGQRLHGIYNKEDLAYMQKWVIGRWAMQFRRWMRPGWNKRFGSRFMQDSGFMESYGERDKGSFKSLWDFVATPIRQANESDRKMGNAFMSFTTILGDYSKFFMNVGAYANTLSYEEKAKVKQASMELANFALIILVLAFSRKLDDDNEELDESYMFAFYLNQLDRLKSELGGYQPFSVGGSGGWYNEGKKLLASPTATTTTGVNLIQVIAEIASLANGADEDEYFKSGVYSKRLKALVHLTKAVPILNQVQRAYYLPESNQFYRLYQ